MPMDSAVAFASGFGCTTPTIFRSSPAFTSERMYSVSPVLSTHTLFSPS